MCLDPSPEWELHLGPNAYHTALVSCYVIRKTTRLPQPVIFYVYFFIFFFLFWPTYFLPIWLNGLIYLSSQTQVHKEVKLESKYLDETVLKILFSWLPLLDEAFSFLIRNGQL